MTAAPQTKRIGVFGHAGTKNLGDEAVFAAVVQNVGSRFPEAEIIGFTINPEDTVQRHGIRTFPIRRIDSASEASLEPGSAGTLVDIIKRHMKWSPLPYALVKALHTGLRRVLNIFGELKFLVQCAANLRETDLLLFAGSQQLNDAYGGPWGFPYTLFKWSIIARITGTKTGFLSVGAGPIQSPLSRFFIKCALSLSSYRSYRDEISCDLVKTIGVRGENHVSTDLAYGIRISQAPGSNGSRSHLVVGVSPVPFYDHRYWPVGNPDIYKDYVAKLAGFGQCLIRDGHTVRFFPTQLRADELVIKDIRSKMRLDGTGYALSAEGDSSILTVDDLVSEISKMDFVVANRYHGILFGLLLRKPVLAIAYHKKSLELMAQMGLSEYVLDSDSIRVDTLINRFDSLRAKRDLIREKIEGKIEMLQLLLEKQYGCALSLIETHPSSSSQDVTAEHVRGGLQQRPSPSGFRAIDPVGSDVTASS
jgi:polysaccharide pyruvyl transferase WcaK-like protein